MAIVHAMVPDHWLPFVIIGKERNWQRSKVLLMTFFSMLLHTIISVGFGLIAYLAGLKAAKVLGEYMEIIGSILLIIFGTIYGLKSHLHREKIDKDETRSVIMLVIIVGFSPCILLIPVFFISAPFGLEIAILAIASYSIPTILTALMMSFIGYTGIQYIIRGKLEKNSELLSGMIIAALGVILLIFRH